MAKITGAAVFPGDLSGDGQINGLDVDPFMAAVLSGLYNGLADMNQDGVVNGIDVAPFVAAVVGGGGQAGVALNAAAMSPTTERSSSRLLRARHVHDGNDHSQLIHHRAVERVMGSRLRLGRDGHRSPQRDMAHEAAGDWQATVDRAFGDGGDWLR